MKTEIKRTKTAVCFTVQGSKQHYWCSILQWELYESKQAILNGDFSAEAVNRFENALREDESEGRDW
jgi:hypothetical protein